MYHIPLKSTIFVYVKAHQNDTRVRVVATKRGRTSWRTYVLGEGEYREFQARSDQPLHIVANKGVEVAQFSKSFEADNVRNSDPFMTILPPTDQFSGNYTFTTPVTFFPKKQDYDHYVAIVIEEEASDGLLLNGELLTNDSFLAIWRHVGHTNLTAMTLNITSGTHILTHTDLLQTFGAYIYGLKFQEAYGHALGQRVNTIDYVCTRTFVIIRDRFDNDCDGRLDEEVENEIDDDGDGLVDEDLDGELPTTAQWTTESAKTTTEPTTTLTPTTTHEPTTTTATTTTFETTGAAFQHTSEPGLYQGHTVEGISGSGGYSGGTASDNTDQQNTITEFDLNNGDGTITTYVNNAGNNDGKGDNGVTDNNNNGSGGGGGSIKDATTKSHLKDDSFTDKDSIPGNSNNSSMDLYLSTNSQVSNNNGGDQGHNSDTTKSGRVPGEPGADTTVDPHSYGNQPNGDNRVTDGNGGSGQNMNAHDTSSPPDISGGINSGPQDESLHTTVINKHNANDGTNGKMLTQANHVVTRLNQNGDQNGINDQPNSGHDFITPTFDFLSQVTENSVTESNTDNLVTNDWNTNSNNSGDDSGHLSNGKGGRSSVTEDSVQNVSAGSTGQNDGSDASKGDNNQNANGDSGNGSNNGPGNGSGNGSKSGSSNGSSSVSNNGSGNGLNGGSGNGSNNRFGNSSGNYLGSTEYHGNGMNGHVVWSTTDSITGNGDTKDSLKNKISTTQTGDKSTVKNGTGSKTTKKPPDGGKSTSEKDNNSNSWWTYLLIALGIILFFIILIIIIIKKCKRKAKRKNSVKSEYMGIPLIASRSNSTCRSITPPIPMAKSIPQFIADSPVPSPKLLAPPTATHPRPSDLGNSSEPSEENYNPAEGIWSSVNNDKRRKSKVSTERRLSSSSFLNLPDVIISVPHSKHITLKQLYPGNKIFYQSTA